MSIATFYLLVAAALMFGACVFAARKAFPQLETKQFATIALIALAMVSLIWTLLSVAANKPPATPASTATESPLLQPSQD